MDWKQELDALMSESAALAKRTGTTAPIQKLPQPPPVDTIAEPPSPVSRLQPLSRGSSEREQIANRVANFKAHQARVQREREDYFSRTMQRARDLAEGRSENSTGEPR